MAEAVAMTTEEIPPRPVQLRHASPARDAVHHAGANEMRPRPAEAAGDADDADGFGHVFPFAAAHADAVGQMEPIGLGAQIDGRDLLAVARPLPATHPTGTQAACAVQPIHVDRPAGFHGATP
jgi:hypothetical protein